MKIKRIGSIPSTAGPESYFTGAVRVDGLVAGDGPAHVSSGTVTFEPAARTAWHTHPLGQMLVVTSGAGRVQSWGNPIDEIHAGDIVWFPAGEKHWHGAASTTAMTHIAIQESVDGNAVTWLEKVTDEQYKGY